MYNFKAPTDLTNEILVGLAVKEVLVKVTAQMTPHCVV